MADLFGVELESCGARRVAVLSKVRQTLSLSITEVKSILDAGPLILTSGTSERAAQVLSAELRALGATVRIFISSSAHEFEMMNSDDKCSADRQCSKLYSAAGDYIGYCRAENFTGRHVPTYRTFRTSAAGEQWCGTICDYQIFSISGDRIGFIFGSRLVWKGDLVGYMKDNRVFNKAGECIATSDGNADANAIAGAAYLLQLTERIA